MRLPAMFIVTFALLAVIITWLLWPLGGDNFTIETDKRLLAGKSQYSAESANPSDS